MTKRHYIRPLQIPWISSYKDLLQRYAEQQVELAASIKETDKWRQAFWDMMFKKYNRLSASDIVDPKISQQFKTWLEQMLQGYSLEGAYWSIKQVRFHIAKTKVEIQQLENHLKRLQLKRDTLVRRLRVAKDPVNQDMQEANALLDTPKSPKLRLLTGGKDGPPPKGANWLMELEEGCIFGCKRKGDMEFVAYQFKIDWKGERMVLLSSEIPQRLELPVDSMGFSLNHELIEIQRKGYGSDN